MAHHVYQTDGFVIGGRDISEANRYCELFTRELGLVRAVARSIRKEKSKLRYHMQDFSRARIALVRGREVFRLTGAVSYDNLYIKLKGSPEKLNTLARIIWLLKRLVHGEGRNDYLFSSFSHGVEYLLEKASQEELRDVENIVALRILFSLGYLPSSSSLEPILESTEITKKALTCAEGERDKLEVLIGNSIAESHL
jgi:DNA repair protein RecO (recombination protein O)|tara:strand:- start:36969 stop:37559 length:591 start_codon:yes stop_codon:yes gene_type:complete